MGTLGSTELNACQLLNTVTAARSSLPAAVLVKVHVGAITAQLVIQRVCQSTRGNTVSLLAP